MSVMVWPELGTTVTLESAAVITASGSSVTWTNEISELMAKGRLLHYDPTFANPNPSPLPGHDVGLSYDSASLLRAAIGAYDGAFASTRGCTVPGDGGGGLWYWDTADSVSADDIGTCLGSGAGRWKRVFSGPLNVRWFGARGDGDQSLITGPAYFSVVSHTQQTRDGWAIIYMFRANRTRGGGEMFIPAGEYRVYGFLESPESGTTNIGGTTTFPPLVTATPYVRGYNVVITGEGADKTVIKNTDSAPSAHGFGVLQTGFAGKALDRVVSVAVRDLTIDGAADARGTLTESYSGGALIYGPIRFLMSNVRIVNCSGDSLQIGLHDTYAGWEDPPNGGSLTDCQAAFEDCEFGACFRNSVSVIHGARIRISRCKIHSGGTIDGGTLPGYCVDVEPDLTPWPVRDCSFVDCSIVGAAGGPALASCTGSEAKFVNCKFTITHSSTTWPLLVQGSRCLIQNCDFRNEVTYKSWISTSSDSFYESGYFGSDTMFSMLGCTGIGVGFLSSARNQVISDCHFSNSLYPFLFAENLGVPFDLCTIKNLSLVNVIDRDNAGGGTVAGFVYKNGANPVKRVVVDGIDVTWSTAKLPTDHGNRWWTPLPSGVCGIHLNPNVNANSIARFANMSSTGWRLEYPAAAGVSPTPDSYRAFSSPIDAPPDTVGAVTLGAAHFTNCVQDYFNYAGNINSKVVSTFTAAILRAIKPNQHGIPGLTLGGAAVGDGNGKLWWWDITDTTSVDDGTTVLGSGTGRWKAI